jgi:4-hydroxy-4-methyl-2-oxoglutarate aldolase
VWSGDWIVGDADGVTVVPRDHLDEVLAAGQARAEREAGLFTELRKGATTIDLLGLDPSPIDGA